MREFIINFLKRPAVWKAVGIALVAAGLSAQYAEILQYLGPEIVDAAVESTEGAR